MHMLLQLVTPFLQTFGADCGAKYDFFGLKPWYYYLTVTEDPVTHRCELGNFKILGSDSSFLLIALAVADDLFRIVAFVSIGFIIYGGITYVTSQGAPDQTSKAQQTIINALIGLVVALLAAGLVNFLGTRLSV